MRKAILLLAASLLSGCMAVHHGVGHGGMGQGGEHESGGGSHQD